MKLNISLKQSWMFIVLFAVIAPVISVMIWYGTTMYKFQLNTALKVESQVNEDLQYRIEAEIRRFITLLSNKSDPLSDVIDKPELISQVYKLLGLIVEREDAIHETMVLSMQAKVIADVDPGMGILGDRLLSPDELQAVAIRAGFNHAYEVPEVVIPSLGRVYIGAPRVHDNKFAFSMAVPIGKPVKAVLVAIIDVDKLWIYGSDAEHTSDAYKTRNYMLDRRGVLLSKIDDSRYMPGDLMTHLAISRTALINGEWPIDSSYIGVAGQNVYGTLTTIPSLSWTLISEVPADKIINPIKTSLTEIALMTVFIVIIFVWFVIRLVNKTLAPIEQACDAIDMVAQGSYDFNLHSSGVRELDKMISGITLMTHARQKAESLLESKEKEQSEMLNFMVNAVISIDENGKILSFNKAAEDLFGYSVDEIIGGKVERLMPEPFAAKHDGYVQHFMHTGDARVIGTGRDVEGLRKNNEIFPMRLFVAELPEGRDGKRRFIGSCADLTLVRQQEDQLRQSQKMDALGKLTGGIAHDFNNMLGVIMGYAELLEDALDEQPGLAQYAEEIHHAGCRGAKLTQKLLSFSRQKKSNAEIVNINNLLCDEQHMLEKTLTARIKLIYELEKNLWNVELDSGDLEDGLVNMSINAMHAMVDGGELVISTKNQTLSDTDAQNLGLHKGDYVALSICDTGCGMDKSTMGKIFDPFYTTKGEYGIGLGLSQVYGFAERSEGTIIVDSEIDRGTCFTFYFPRYYDEDYTEAPVVDDISVEIKGNETILVVDDEPALLGLTGEVLSSGGYKVIYAQSGKQALEILAAESVHLLLSDVVMPVMDGYQLAKIVQEKYPLVKIQLISGYTGEQHNAMPDNILHENILNKPCEFNVLLARVRDLLDES